MLWLIGVYALIKKKLLHYIKENLINPFRLPVPSFVQMKMPAPPKISIAVTESAWHPSLSATVTTTVGTPATRTNALPPPVASTSSVAMTLNASLPCGAAMATQTAKTSRTSPWSAAAAGRSPRNPAVRASSSAAVESAFTCTGSVTVMQTAKINQMKQTVVSQLWLYQCLCSWEWWVGWQMSAEHSRMIKGCWCCHYNCYQTISHRPNLFC